ncbi:MAG: ABC transporter ATP-binding protein [Planctomycetaceae bacterium]|nr:ABC transporter ATP-binding protein [Planctomycetaceae bacterium]
MNLIEFQNVSFAYGTQPVLHDLSVKIEANSFWTIIGPNGSGKSTFLGLLSNILHPQKGMVLLENTPVSQYSGPSLASKIALVRQEFIPVYGFSVFQTVLMGRFNYSKGLLFESEGDRQAAKDALEATDTLDLADRSISHLSGGERQRVFVARALAQETPILLLDEPTSHLDLKHQVKIFDLLKQMQMQKGKTIVLVSHDVNLACQYTDNVLLLDRGQKAFFGTPAEIMGSGRIESVFQVTGFHGTIGKGGFFMPLGRLSKDKSP